MRSGWRCSRRYSPPVMSCGNALTGAGWKPTWPSSGRKTANLHAVTPPWPPRIRAARGGAARSDAGAVILTARDACLMTGYGVTISLVPADYVIKPFVLPAVVARVNALLRRMGRDPLDAGRRRPGRRPHRRRQYAGVQPRSRLTATEFGCCAIWPSTAARSSPRLKSFPCRGFRRLRPKPCRGVRQCLAPQMETHGGACCIPWRGSGRMLPVAQ